MSIWKSKSFKYKIADTYIFKPIQVDISKCQSINDLKKKIAIELNVFDYKLHFINPPNETQLKKIREYFTFNLAVDDCCKNIDFVFFKRKIIQITNCYKMTYYQIIKSFQKKGLYFSNQCAKKYIHFKILGKELPHIEYPLLGIPYERHLVDVEFGCLIVPIKYGLKQFLFAENERASEAYNLINETYKDCSDISILNINNYTIKRSDKLKKSIQYFVHVDYRVSFKYIKTESECILYLDSLSRIFEAKKNIATIYSSNRQLDPESIIIFDVNKNIIEDPRKMLKSIQDLDKCFYFDINKKNKYVKPATPPLIKSPNRSLSWSFDYDSPISALKRNKKRFDYKPKYKGEQNSSNENSFNEDENNSDFDFSEEQQQSYNSDQITFEEEEEELDGNQDQQSARIKYYYQTCKDSKINEIDLEQDATVLALKKLIAEQNQVENLLNIKIIFNGHELMDDDYMRAFQIGDSKLFVYIRTKEDIQIMKDNDIRLSNDTNEILYDDDDNDNDDEGEAE